MSRIGVTVAAIMSLSALAGCQGAFRGTSPGRQITLWNGRDFSGWSRYVADPAVDVNDVWRIRGDVLHCAGKPNGYIRTTDKYKNYHLHLEWRWPDEALNSGVLLHANGPDQVWPACIECQLKAGSAGDFVLINGTGLSVEGADRRNPAKQFVVIEKTAAMAEKPAGQWNTYDIYSDAGSIRCFVNGILQNEGTGATASSGWICLQSEGSPIEFRNIYLLPLD